jgi:hypothetical protein
MAVSEAGIIPLLFDMLCSSLKVFPENFRRMNCQVIKHFLLVQLSLTTQKYN